MIDPLTVKYGSNLLDNPLIRKRVSDVLDATNSLAACEPSEYEAYVIDKYIGLTMQTTGYTDPEFVKSMRVRIMQDISMNTVLNADMKLYLYIVIVSICDDQISYIKWVKEGVYE